jgi:predicted DsbA family dithiol-disulfide isomerase
MTCQPAHITVDIVSDVVCPWCVIGYRQLEAAITNLGNNATVALRWHPFELVPGMAPEGQNLTHYVQERYGASLESSRANRDRMIEMGKPLGIDFRYSNDSRIYNTHKAHELLLWAVEKDKQTELKLALFRAYFTDQANVSDETVLLDAAERVGLDRAEAKAALEDHRYADAVTTEISYWQDQNITGVPAYIFNGKFLVPGAQDVAVFDQIFGKLIAA